MSQKSFFSPSHDSPILQQEFYMLLNTPNRTNDSTISRAGQGNNNDYNPQGRLYGSLQHGFSTSTFVKIIFSPSSGGIMKSLFICFANGEDQPPPHEAEWGSTLVPAKLITRVYERRLECNFTCVITHFWSTQKQSYILAILHPVTCQSIASVLLSGLLVYECVSAMTSSVVCAQSFVWPWTHI